MAFSEQRRRAFGGVAIVVACLSIVAYQGCWRKETPTNTAPSPPIGIAPPPSFGPAEPPSFGSSQTKPALTEADQQITKLENRRETLIPLLEKAEDEKAELVAKLREAGVAKSSDLKNNPTAQRYAVALQKVSHDIKTLQGEIGRLDEAITHAKALSRRAEQDKVRISDEELAALTVDSGKDSPLTASDPANLDALLAKELTGDEGGRPSPHPRTFSTQLIGRWEVTGSRKTGTVEFTKGGTALVSWDDGFANGLGQRGRSATLKYSVRGQIVKLEEPGDVPYRQQQEMTVEVVSADEMIVVVTKQAMSFDWIEGRLKRIK